MDNKKTITAKTDKGKIAQSVYITKKDYEEIKAIWLSMEYTDISEYK